MNIQPFKVNIPQATLDDLHERLARTRWPDEVEEAGWDYGTNLTYLKSLVALVKQNPGKYTYGSSGLGSILHLCGEQFKALAGGINIVHVPYRGSAPMMSDLVGGQISMAFDATPTAMPQAQSGAIRAIGAGMATRMRAMPQLPTLQEQGLKGFECYTWNATDLMRLRLLGGPCPIHAGVFWLHP